MLKLNEKFKITGDDDLNYTLYELKVIQPKDKSQEARMDWVLNGYFGKVSHALLCALDKYIKDLITEEDLSCKALLERLKEIEKDLKKVDVTYGHKLKLNKNQKEEIKSEDK